MRTLRVPVTILAVLLCPCLTLAADTPVGKISLIEGVVALDAFGNGAFIRAEAGDLLYQRSVVRTGEESWATLEVLGAKQTVGPLSSTPIASFIARQQRSPVVDFFRRLWDTVTGAAAPEAEAAVLGSRADPVEDRQALEMVLDSDADSLYEEAEQAAGRDDWREAVKALRAIAYPDEGSFALDEYFSLLAYGLLMLGDAHAAMEACFQYALAPAEPRAVPLLTPALQVLAGISAYLAGSDEIAVAALDAYLGAVGLARAVPHAIGVRLELYRRAGALANAESLANRALAARGANDWDRAMQGR